MKRGIIYGLIAVGLLALWGTMRRHDKHVDQQISARVLGPDDHAKYIVDEKHHTFTRIERKPGGGQTVTKTFLNPHGPVDIVEKNSGATVLVQRTWGTELSPFIGGAFGSDFKFRVAAGVNGFYIQRWEVGGGLLLNASEIRDLRVFGALGYNLYSAWLISAGMDNHKAVHIIASVRF